MSNQEVITTAWSNRDESIGSIAVFAEVSKLGFSEQQIRSLDRFMNSRLSQWGNDTIQTIQPFTARHGRVRSKKGSLHSIQPETGNTYLSRNVSEVSVSRSISVGIDFSLCLKVDEVWLRAIASNVTDRLIKDILGRLRHPSMSLQLAYSHS